MKVVLFCGGEGTRLREYSESIPKPMVPVGYRPINRRTRRHDADLEGSIVHSGLFRKHVHFDADFPMVRKTTGLS